LTIPLAFKLTAESTVKLETRIRHACCDLFYRERLLAHIIDDIDRLLNLTRPMPQRNTSSELSATEDEAIDFDHDPALPSALWAPPGEASANAVEGGVNYGRDDSGEGADLIAG
jgi:hypothetical protein